MVDVLHRIRGPFNVSTPAQVAGIAALEDLEHQERARAHNERWLPWLAERLSAPGWRCIRASRTSSWSGSMARATPRRPAPGSSSGASSPAMAAYGLPHCLRLSVGLEDENRAAIAALQEFMA